MNFEYAINPNSETPIFQINQHIGFDNDVFDISGKLIEKGDGQGINGVKFSREVFEVDALYPKPRLLTFYHNSFGGDVKQGYDIFNAIVNAKTKTKSIIAGFCYSTDGWIALAADIVHMYDFGLWMCHNPYDPTGKKDKSGLLKDVARSIAKIISAKSGRNGKPKKSVDEVLEMMQSTTRWTAQKMYDAGLIDEVLDSNGKIKKEYSDDELQNNYKEIRAIFNKFIPNNDNNSDMSYKNLVNRLNKIKINNKAVVNLSEESGIEDIEGGITRIENAANDLQLQNSDLNNTVLSQTEKIRILNESQEANQKRMQEMQTSNSDMANQISQKDAAYNALKTEHDTMCLEMEVLKNKEKEDITAAKKIEVSNYVKEQVYLGKVEDNEEVINKCIEEGMKNFDGLKFIMNLQKTNMFVPKPVNKGADNGGVQLGTDDDENEPESDILKKRKLQNKERHATEKTGNMRAFLEMLNKEKLS